MMEKSLDEEVNSRPLISGKHVDHESHGNGKPDEYITMVPVATSGPCYSECQMIFPFMVLLFFMTLLVAVTQMPVLMLVLRYILDLELPRPVVDVLNFFGGNLEILDFP